MHSIEPVMRLVGFLFFVVGWIVGWLVMTIFLDFGDYAFHRASHGVRVVFIFFFNSLLILMIIGLQYCFYCKVCHVVMIMIILVLIVSTV